MHTPARDEITGLVLAGGRATRMGGVDKGLVESRGRPLIEAVIERLRPQVGPILISANRNIGTYRGFGYPVLLDADDGLEPFPGPLAGVLAGLRAASTAWVAVVPCDAPLFPADLVIRLADALGAGHAAVACAGEKIEPVFCLLHADLAGDLAAALAHGERRAGAWLRGIGAARAEFPLPESFANLNTLLEVHAHDGRQ
jgi:molybdopterin-guanine dinucleotide biosynthesis protein A